MNSVRLFLRPAALLFALVLVAAAGARPAVDPKDNMQRAADKIHDMWSAADKGDFDSVVSAGDSATEYMDLASISIEDQISKNVEGYGRSKRELDDAREWTKQTIKDAKAREKNDCFEHATKALGSISHAVDDLPK